MSLDHLNAILDELVVEGLIERHERNGKSYMALTSDGKRCNRIIVID